MAIYALAIKHKAKGRGASAVAHAKYIAREGKYADKGRTEAAKDHAQYLTREGRHQKRAHELEATWSGNMPAWAKTPGEYWDAADTFERANGRVYTEVVIALPRELSKGSRESLVRDFVAKEVGESFPYTVAIHNPNALDGGEQPHAHVMFSLRERDGIERPKELYFKRANSTQPERGGAKKSRAWSMDERSNDRVNEIRATWEELANKALQKEGHEARIDRRSLEAQGIDREPEPKMGPAVTQRLKRGQETEVGQKVLELRNYRKLEKEEKELEREISRERARVYNFAEEKERRSGEGELRFYGERREVPEEERQKYRRTVDLVLTRYEREDGDTEYRWKKSGKVAFTDKGDRITFNTITPISVKAGLQVAKEKGWDKVEARGKEEFRREAWIQGQLMGMEVSGYVATKTDFDKVETMKKEQALKREQYREREGQGTGRSGPDNFGDSKDLPHKPERTSEPQKHEKAIGGTWVKASDFIKDIDERIKAARGKDSKESKKELDELYRQKFDLKQLGDERVEVERSADGKMRLKEPGTVSNRAREIERGQKKDKGVDRGRD